MWLPDNFKPHAWFVIDFQRRARGLREAAQRDNGCPGQGLPASEPHRGKCEVGWSHLTRLVGRWVDPIQITGRRGCVCLAWVREQETLSPQPSGLVGQPFWK